MKISKHEKISISMFHERTTERNKAIKALKKIKNARKIIRLQQGNSPSWEDLKKTESIKKMKRSENKALRLKHNADKKKLTINY